MQDLKEKTESKNPQENLLPSKEGSSKPKKKRKSESKKSSSITDSASDEKTVKTESTLSESSSEEPSVTPEVVEVLEKLNPKDRELVSTVIAERHSGPIPHPRILNGYEKVLPGSADRIIKMAENQSNHRISLEEKMITSDISYRNRGLILGFLLGLILLLGGLGLLFVGKSITGLTVLAGAAVAIAGPLITGRLSNSSKVKEEVESE